MAYQDGWRFGFCPTEEKMKDATSFYQEKHSNPDRFDLKKGKSGHHGGEHHHTTTEQCEEAETPFVLMLEEDGTTVLEENMKLKAEIQLVEQRTEALGEYCREHVENMTSTIAGMLRPLSNVE